MTTYLKRAIRAWMVVTTILLCAIWVLGFTLHTYAPGGMWPALPMVLSEVVITIGLLQLVSLAFD